MTNSFLLNKVSCISIPCQPFLELSTIDYCEKLIRLNEVSNKSQCLFYEFTTTKNASLIRLPDGCLDILVQVSGSNNISIISGIHNKSNIYHLKPKTRYFGIKPYSAFGMKGFIILPSELYNTTLLLKDVLKNSDITEKLSIAQSFNERINIFYQHYKKYWVDDFYMPSLKEYCAVMLCSPNESEAIANIETATGYSGRYCRKCFKTIYNCSLKTYSKIIRIQMSIRKLFIKSSKNISIASIAYDLGYYDEAHFINDFKTSTNTTPNQMRTQLKSIYHQK